MNSRQPAKEKRVPVRSDADIVEVRLAARALAESLGFNGTDLVVIATAVSEVARNIVEYAKRGEVILSALHKSGTAGISVVARDNGPGIPDTAQAMQEGYSTSRGLGLGLPGARRLMDEFEIVSKIGYGTTISMRKWLHR